jgi:osmotically-inducible protein OsmY
MKTDFELQKDVMDEIRFDPQLKDIATEIGISAKDGMVTISGMVDTYLKKTAIENAVQRVAGVKVVAVDVEVKTPPSSMKSDIEIATAVKNALNWHSAVNDDLIEIKVDNGWVYLNGTVEWDYMKKAAEKAIGDLKGVRGITNKINVNTKALDPVEVKRKINAAFHRSATIDAANIYVEVIGSKITLTGKVRTWAERNDAEDAAWSLPGAITVDNKIEVDTSILVHAE